MKAIRVPGRRIGSVSEMVQIADRPGRETIQPDSLTSPSQRPSRVKVANRINLTVVVTDPPGRFAVDPDNENCSGARD